VDERGRVGSFAAQAGEETVFLQALQLKQVKRLFFGEISRDLG
jgi:hypothetical protein